MFAFGQKINSDARTKFSEQFYIEERSKQLSVY